MYKFQTIEKTKVIVMINQLDTHLFFHMHTRVNTFFSHIQIQRGSVSTYCSLPCFSISCDLVDFLYTERFLLMALPCLPLPPLARPLAHAPLPWVLRPGLCLWLDGFLQARVPLQWGRAVTGSRLSSGPPLSKATPSYRNTLELLKQRGMR